MAGEMAGGDEGLRPRASAGTVIRREAVGGEPLLRPDHQRLLEQRQPALQAIGARARDLGDPGQIGPVVLLDQRDMVERLEVEAAAACLPVRTTMLKLSSGPTGAPSQGMPGTRSSSASSAACFSPSAASASPISAPIALALAPSAGRSVGRGALEAGADRVALGAQPVDPGLEPAHLAVEREQGVEIERRRSSARSPVRTASGCSRMKGRLSIWPRPCGRGGRKIKARSSSRAARLIAAPACSGSGPADPPVVQFAAAKGEQAGGGIGEAGHVGAGAGHPPGGEIEDRLDRHAALPDRRAMGGREVERPARRPAIGALPRRQVFGHVGIAGELGERARAALRRRGEQEGRRQGQRRQNQEQGERARSARARWRWRARTRRRAGRGTGIAPTGSGAGSRKGDHPATTRQHRTAAAAQIERQRQAMNKAGKPTTAITLA